MRKPIEESSAVDPMAELDEVDEMIDYESIVARTEADRQAGRVLGREEMRARTERKLAELRAKRRSA